MRIRQAKMNSHKLLIFLYFPPCQIRIFRTPKPHLNTPISSVSVYMAAGEPPFDSASMEQISLIKGKPTNSRRTHAQCPIVANNLDNFLLFLFNFIASPGCDGHVPAANMTIAGTPVAADAARFVPQSHQFRISDAPAARSANRQFGRSTTAIGR